MRAEHSNSERTILVTGATGTVGLPVAVGLAADNDVIAIARFGDAAARAILEAASVRCIPCDLVAGDLTGVPRDVDHVINFARPSNDGADFDRAITAHAESIGLLMSHCTTARSVLHCSSTSMYARRGVAARETDPITDDRHRRRPTYTIAKVCAEASVRTLTRVLKLPATIARLNVPYSDRAGWPASHLRAIVSGQPIQVHPDGPNLYNPIHTDDVLRTVPALLDAAAVPATIVNWAGIDEVSIEEWSGYLGALVGSPPILVPSPDATEGITVDTSRLVELAGPMTVAWKDGMRRMAKTLYPQLAT